jgi:tetratricopeptide (TPR) repeat protein
MLILWTLVGSQIVLVLVYALEKSAASFLTTGNTALAQDQFDVAIDNYKAGLALIDEDESVLTALSLYTNLATTFSTIQREEEAVEYYKKALLYHSDVIDDLVEDSVIEDANSIAAQAAFFLGLVYQNLDQTMKAADAYAFANTLDPYHWASLGNLGAVLHDELRKYDEALVAYNKAYEILTQTEHEPTDPPEDPNLMLAELQYRIGLCINHDLTRKCALRDDPDIEVPCKEMATNAFSLATQYNPKHEAAKHMLAAITADATMKRASNDYVKSLFDDYARK